METLTAFLVGILSSLAAVGLMKYKLLFNLLPKITTKGYLIDLEKKIRQMPFIYKDLDTDVFNDFVDVEFQSLDLGTLKLKTSNKILTINEDEKLKRNSKVLFLGSAGIGKTTFQRRAIITIIKKKSYSKFLYGKEKPIPLYIPLKAIDNSEPFPIYRYIMNNPLFANYLGWRRLLSLARKRHLFLFLDGYDEIPFTGGTRNFVQEELGVLLGLLDAEKDSSHKILADCRIWLSSRKEFFEKNPIADLGSSSRTREEGLTAIELRGIGNNRIKLVRKIFDKYRERSKEFYEFLNEEYFLFEIDNSDDEIKLLSYNPLFLTVMCYIYAQKAIDKENHKVEWARKFDELILECIELLLNDLDANKARDLPKAHKEALLTRRNPFVEEKKLFLQYFSLQLYFDNKPVFTLPYLKQQLQDFFEIEFPFLLILQDLNTDNASKPNAALQLIYQGVFVLVDTNRDEVFYDFPHRRFREVLASKYINTPERYERLLANAERKQFGEFLNVFFKSEIYSDLSFHDETLILILNKALGHNSDDVFVKITLQFVKLKPSNYNPGKVVERFLTDAVLSDKGFIVSAELLRNCKIDENFTSIIKTELISSTKTLNYVRFSICASILQIVLPFTLNELLLPLIATFLADREILPIIFQHLTSLDTKHLPLYKRKIDESYFDFLYFVSVKVFLNSDNVMPIIFLHLGFIERENNLGFIEKDNIPAFARLLDEKDEAFMDFCYALTFNLNNDDYWLRFINESNSDFWSDIDSRRLLVFFYFVYKFCPNRYENLQNQADFSIKMELFEYVERHYEEDVVKNVSNEKVCILSQNKIKNIIQLIESRQTAFLVSKLFEYKEKDKSTGKETFIKEFRFAVVPITNKFRNDLADSLKQIEFKAITRKELDNFIATAINKPIEKLNLLNPKFIKFAELPDHVRSPTAEDFKYSNVTDWRDVKQKDFQSQLQDLLKKDTFHKNRDVKSISEITKSIHYTPTFLTDHFQ